MNWVLLFGGLLALALAAVGVRLAAIAAAILFGVGLVLAATAAF